MSQVQEIRKSITEELSVLDDDIHVTSDEDAVTFYLPPDLLEQAEDVLGRELQVLEEHEHEYLVKADL
jgi:hypothetical protein